MTYEINYVLWYTNLVLINTFLVNIILQLLLHLLDLNKLKPLIKILYLFLPKNRLSTQNKISK